MERRLDARVTSAQRVEVRGNVSRLLIADPELGHRRARSDAPGDAGSTGPCCPGCWAGGRPGTAASPRLPAAPRRSPWRPGSRAPHGTRCIRTAPARPAAALGVPAGQDLGLRDGLAAARRRERDATASKPTMRPRRGVGRAETHSPLRLTEPRGEQRQPEQDEDRARRHPHQQPGELLIGERVRRASAPPADRIRRTRAATTPRAVRRARSLWTAVRNTYSTLRPYRAGRSGRRPSPTRTARRRTTRHRCWTAWIASLRSAASYSAARARSTARPPGAERPRAGRSRSRHAPNRRRPRNACATALARAGGSAHSHTSSGCPNVSSGAATSISSVCWVMWAEKTGSVKPRPAVTPARTTSVSHPAAKTRGRPHRDAAPHTGAGRHSRARPSRHRAPPRPAAARRPAARAPSAVRACMALQHQRRESRWPG